MIFLGLIYYGYFRGVHFVDRTGKASKMLMTVMSCLLRSTVALH
jgi:hypothetical protein